MRRQAEGGYEKPALLLVAVAGLLGVLSHGVLDGLKHGYPIPPVPGILLGALLAAVWIVSVHTRFALLFAVAIGGALLPDVIDLGPDIARHQLGIRVPAIPYGHIFPWHWGEGSGSLYPGSGDSSRDLSTGRNQAVSYTNHAIVVAFALAGILMAPRVYRWNKPQP